MKKLKATGIKVFRKSKFINYLRKLGKKKKISAKVLVLDRLEMFDG